MNRVFEFTYLLYVTPCFLNIIYFAIIMNDEFFWQGFSKKEYWARNKQERTINFLFTSFLPLINLVFASVLGAEIFMRYFFPDKWTK